MIGVSTELVEQQVLGALFLAPDQIGEVADRLGPQHFEGPDCRRVFKAMAAASKAGETIEPTVIIRRLGDRPADYELVSDLAGLVGSAELLPHYVQQVSRADRLRRLRRMADRVRDQAADPAADPDALLQSLTADLSQIEAGAGPQRLRPLRDSLETTLRDLDERRRNGGGVSGIKTGLEPIDRNLLGLRPGEMIVLGGTPGVGKTALALQVADRAATDGHRVLFYSMEMPAPSLVERMLARRAQVNGALLRAGALSPDDVVLVEAVGNDLYNQVDDRLIIDDRGGVTPARIAADLAKESLRGGAGLVIVDHLQLMRTDGGAGSRYETTTQISGDLKALALRFQVPVLALSQLSRGVHARAGGRPTLGDLRDSGAIEQDADAVVFLWEQDGGTRLGMGKNRNGPTGDLDGIAFDKAVQTFKASP